MSSNGKVMRSAEALVYSMPSFEDDSLPGKREKSLQRIEELQRKAYEEGFAVGEKAGFAEGERRASVLIGSLEKIIEDVDRFKEGLVDAVEEQVVGLATALARKIIAEEIRTRPEVIVSVVRESLKKLQRMGRITLKINPALHDLIMKNKSQLTDIHEDIAFDINANVSLTGPLVISQTEEVVTDIEALMANMVSELEKVHAEKIAAAGSVRRDQGKHPDQGPGPNDGAETGGRP
ncbi:MAG: hypothetical protein JSU90_04385 [Nitrospiraceae bacterium]|nr:MAG: hypothetical protein JSU90_04385 [Nitrospiraceae bacterium]